MKKSLILITLCALFVGCTPTNTPRAPIVESFGPNAIIVDLPNKTTEFIVKDVDESIWYVYVYGGGAGPYKVQHETLLIKGNGDGPLHGKTPKE